MDEDGNFIIVDYKTGKYPPAEDESGAGHFPAPGLRRQGPAAPLRQRAGPQKPIGLAYYDLAGKTGAGARDVVLFNTDFKKDQPASKPKASPKSAEDFETILKQSMDKARKAVEGILAGDFTSTPQDENKCRYRPNEVMREKGRGIISAVRMRMKSVFAYTGRMVKGFFPRDAGKPGSLEGPG